jgi:short-subunit dehydrogenase
MMPAEEVASHVYKAVMKKKRRLVLTFYQGKLTVLVSKIFPNLVDRQVYKTFAEEPDSPLK